MRRWTRLVALSAMILAIGGSAAQAQIPAPRTEWEPWKEVAQCGGARYFASYSRYDGRNDPEAKFRIQNDTGHQIATRFEARFTARAGGEAQRTGGSRVGAGGSVEGPIIPTLSTGILFQTPVNQVLPASVGNLVLDIETADVSKPPPNAGPSTYLSDFRDFPKVVCKDVRVPVPQAPTAPFIALTAACYNVLPRWTPPCDQAVNALVAAFETAPESAKSCILEWRQFQKCYEVYAFESAPDPKPQCQSRIPHCAVPGR